MRFISFSVYQKPFIIKLTWVVRGVMDVFHDYYLSRGMRFPTICILTSVDSDEPLQPPFKLRNSKWCSVSSLTLIEYSSD